jgi:hypothetical protein
MHDRDHNILYLLTVGNSLRIVLNTGRIIISDHKIIKMTIFESVDVQIALFMTDLGIIMYYDTQNNFIELDTNLKVTQNLNKRDEHYVSTCSIYKNLQFYTDNLVFWYENELYYYNPNKLMRMSFIASKIAVVKCFRLSSRWFTYNIYVDTENNKYIYFGVQSGIKNLPLLIDCDVNLPKITSIKSSRNIVSI